MSINTLHNKITTIIEQYYFNSSIKYNKQIIDLLNEIGSNLDNLKTIDDENAIDFALEYLKRKNDLFPDDLPFGLLDDYLVLKFIVYKVIYGYDDSICYSSINQFLKYSEVIELIGKTSIKITSFDKFQKELEVKIKKLNCFDTKLRFEINQITAFLIKILKNDLSGLAKIALWALNYFLQENDAICDSTDFGYVDDFLVLKSAELAIKEKLYHKYPEHYKYLLEYENLFLPFYFEQNNKPLHLNDLQKIISIFFFHEALKGTQKLNFGIVLPEQSHITKTLIYFYYQLGLLAKSFSQTSKDDIIKRLKDGERLLYNKKEERQYIFSHAEGDSFVFIEKENKRGRKSNIGLVKNILPKDKIFNEPYEIIPITSKGNVSNKIQNDFIGKYLKLIMANHLNCSLSEVDLIDASPDKIIFSPLGRVYSIIDYEQLSVNELNLNKIFPIAKIDDEGNINNKNLQASSKHGFINAYKTNHPTFARDLIIDAPEEYNAFFIDFSDINNYKHSCSHFLKDSDMDQIKIPSYIFYNLSQIAFNKIKYSDYYAINQELAHIISFSYSERDNNLIHNPYEIINNFKIENVYFKSNLLEKIQDKINKQGYDKNEIRIIYDLRYYLSSIDKNFKDDEIVDKLKEIIPDIPDDSIKLALYNHYNSYKNAINSIFEKHKCELCSVFSTQLSSDYIVELCKEKRIKSNSGRVHNLLKYPYSKVFIIIPAYTKRIYDAILYPKAFKIYYILDKTKESIHEKRLTELKNFLKCDSESMLSGKKQSIIKPVIISDSIEEEFYNVIKDELNFKINSDQYKHEKKIKVFIVLFDDNSRRFLGFDQRIQLLDYDNEYQQDLSTKNGKDLKPGDPVIWYSAQAEDFDDSLTGIFLQNNKIKSLFEKTQGWRIIIQDIYKKKNFNLSRLQSYLNENNIKVTEATLHNWIEKKYHVYPQSKEKYIPFIFKLANENENESINCIESINRYLKLRHSLGRKIKSFLIHDFSKGEKNIEKWILGFVDENNNPLFSKNDKGIIKALNTILNNIEVLQVEDLYEYEEKVPQSWIGKHTNQV